MVTKMTKYSFILLSEQTEGFLNSLQELGVVDISRSLKPIDEQSSGMLAEADRAKKPSPFSRHAKPRVKRTSNSTAAL